MNGSKNAEKGKKTWKKYGLGLLFFLLLFGIDQWTKGLAFYKLKGKPEFPLWNDVFVLQYLENRGAAFGILQNQRIFLVVLTLVVFVGLVYLYSRIPSGKKFLPLYVMDLLLMAGALGNLVDRLIRGYVVDFLYFKWINFPIFNIADCYVVISAIVSALLMGFYYKEDDFISSSPHGQNEAEQEAGE